MKLAIVIPWFGRDLKGGAEQQAWQIAARLAARGHQITVLTTCCRSHQDDWSTNHLPAGETTEPEGFTIQRFAVAPRDRAAFDRVCGHLLALPQNELRAGVPAVPTEDSATFADELIKSPQLLRYLSDHHWRYDWVLFLPYLYGPVLHGISIVGKRAAFQPCLHDESYAYLPQVATAFHACGKILFNSDGEQELAARLFGPGIWTKSTVAGEGVETPGLSAANRNGNTAPRPRDRFVLYLGRKDAGKNLPLLLNAYRRFRAVRPNTDLRLVLAGNGTVDFNDSAVGIEDLGVVSETRKEELLRDCVALFQPSEKESFSRVMMEAWLHGRPVAAHANCLATAVSVQRARGGWIASDEAEWAALFTEVARTPEKILAQLGECGRVYARELADWDRVMERYEETLAPARNPPPSIDVRDIARAEINQILPNLSYGDAISNHAIWIRNRLRDFGFESNIFVRYIDPRVEHECRVFSPEALHASDAAIYHHSIGSEITPHLLEFTGPKCVVYHNITPAEFFEPYWPNYAPVLRRGREDLPALAPHFDVAVGDSSYNVAELAADGYHNPSVLPIAVDPQKWDFPADEGTMARLQDGRTNILFVGRIAPNKKQDDLAAAFREYLDFDPTARLILVGKAEDNDVYATHVGDVIAQLGIRDSVMLPGSITDAQLAAYYRSAHLFWSMSEHEGFCVPLIEAMWFDVPVLAFRSSAVPETLGSAALMFTDKRNLRELAALARVLATDADLRARIITAQRKQRLTYLPDRVVPIVAKIATDLRASRRARTDRQFAQNGTRIPDQRRATERVWPQLSGNGQTLEIDQCLPNLSPGDAISSQALLIRDALRRLGYRSKILARYRDDDLAYDCEVFTPAALEQSAAVIYHHSIGSEITPHMLAFAGPKALIYHNITPAEFHEQFAPEIAAMLQSGREQLPDLASEFPISFGVSRYNAHELSEAGFDEPGVLPICVDPERWKITPDATAMRELQDGHTNILFVGRISPNKKQDDLIRAFRAYRELEPVARLVLVGASDPGETYSAYLEELVTGLSLQDAVLWPGRVTDAELVACYQSSRLFWSMSEHEGFCVPLIEAMWFDLPVFAFKSAAVPETLAGTGELFSDKSDMDALAARAYALVHDEALRERVLAGQRVRRMDFIPERFEPLLERLAQRLLSASESEPRNGERAPNILASSSRGRILPAHV